MRALAPELAVCAENGSFPASHYSEALCQGTTLVGPLKTTAMRALAPEALLSGPVERFSAACLARTHLLRIE
jgi:hypothetical protein